MAEPETKIARTTLSAEEEDDEEDIYLRLAETTAAKLDVDTSLKIVRGPPRKPHFPGATICVDCCCISGCLFVIEAVGIQCNGCNGLFVENNAFMITKIVGGIRQSSPPCRKCNPHLAIPASARMYCQDCKAEWYDKK